MELTNIIYALIVIITGVSLVKLTSKYINKVRDNKAFKELIKKNSYSEAVLWYASYFIKLGIYIIISLIAISMLGFAQEILTLVAAILILSIIGVLVYSIRDLIPSAFAGAYILRSKLIRKGDIIKVKEFEGKVQEINMLTITIKDEKDNLAIIPNKIILEKIIKKKQH